MKIKMLVVPIMYDCVVTDMVAGNRQERRCSMENYVSLYTDGSCDGNPGPGGYAAILRKGRFYKEVVGSVPHGSNNRMELLAVIKGLSAVKSHSNVTVFSDSQYIVSAVNEGRLAEWQSNGWRRIRTLTPVQNSDLWKVLVSIVKEKNLEVNFQKLKAHKGHKLNNRADYLARQAAKAA